MMMAGSKMSAREHGLRLTNGSEGVSGLPKPKCPFREEEPWLVSRFAK